MNWRATAASAANFLLILLTFALAAAGCDSDSLVDAGKADAGETDIETGPKLPSSCVTNADCNGNGLSPVCQRTYSCIKQQCVAIVGGPLLDQEGTPCSDGSLCTSGDMCSGGVCKGIPQICGDNNDCTSDSCDPSKGCVNAAIQVVCADGNVCTTGDACKNGSCVSSGAVDCNDNNPCTTDSCDPASGCVNTNNTASCTDGNACTVDDVCKDGVCGGVAKVCDDGNPCTSDSCDLIKGCSTANVAAGEACDDGDVDTGPDLCNGKGTCSSKKLTDCEVDADCVGLNPGLCASYVCNTALGLCTPVENVVEDDNNPCTSDVCNPITGTTVHKPTNGSCSDGDVCTSGDYCSEGMCLSGKQQLSCYDGDACTTDVCQAGIGCVNMSLSCDDGNPYTADSCNTKWGCQFATQYLTVNCVDNPKISDSDVAAGCTVTARYSLVLTNGNKLFMNEQSGDNWLKLPMVQVCQLLKENYVLVVKATQYLVGTGQPITTDYPPLIQLPSGALVSGVLDTWSDPLVIERVITAKDVGGWCKQ